MHSFRVALLLLALAALGSVAFAQNTEPGFFLVVTVAEGRDVEIYGAPANRSGRWQMKDRLTGAWLAVKNSNRFQGAATGILVWMGASSTEHGTQLRFRADDAPPNERDLGFVLHVAPPVFPQPGGLLIDQSGGLLVSDATTHTVRWLGNAEMFGWGNDVRCQVFEVIGQAGRSGASDGVGTAALLNQPAGLAAESTESFLVVDAANGALRRVRYRTVSTVAGMAGTHGNVDGPVASATFSTPMSAARGPDGSIFVADTANHTIRRISAGGVVGTLAGVAGEAGNADGPGTAARFNRPTGVAVDSDGTVYVTDTANNLIRTISAAGVVSTLAGLPGVTGFQDGNGRQALFNGPTGIISAGLGCYVADTGNSVIRYVSQAGGVSTYAGIPGVSGLRDAPENFKTGRFEDALFDHPTAIASSTTGILFVADTGNGVIRALEYYDGFCGTLPVQVESTPRPSVGAARYLGPDYAPPPALDPPPPPAPTPTPPPVISDSVPKVAYGAGGGGAPGLGFLAGLGLVWWLRRRTRRA